MAVQCKTGQEAFRICGSSLSGSAPVSRNANLSPLNVLSTYNESQVNLISSGWRFRDGVAVKREEFRIHRELINRSAPVSKDANFSFLDVLST